MLHFVLAALAAPCASDVTAQECPVGVRSNREEPRETDVEKGWSAFADQRGSLMRPRALAAPARLQPPACTNHGDCDDPDFRDQFMPGRATPTLTLDVTLIVFRRSDGSMPAATPAQIGRNLQELADDFEPYKIDFEVDWRYVDDSDYLDGVKTWNDAQQEFAEHPRRSMYVFAGIGGTGSALGYGTWPWLVDVSAAPERSGAMIISRWFRPGSHGLTHEVGHVLGLYHTDDTQGAELFGGCENECYPRISHAYHDWVGDLCRDTPPIDSYATCDDLVQPTDICGESYPHAGLTNFMAPGNRRGHGCGDHFTANQAARMHCWTTATYPGWIRP